MDLDLKKWILTYCFIAGTIVAKAGLSDLLITEVCPINDTTIVDETGAYPDWVELYNDGDVAVNLYGLYLSDDKSDLLKWRISNTDIIIDPKSYTVLWTDNEPLKGSKHLGFKLSKGEHVILYTPSTGIIDSIAIKTTFADISIGRKSTEKSAEFVYFKTPTPGSANSTTSFKGFGSTPEFNYQSGFYNVPINVELSPSFINDSIYYTLDNSDPKPGKPGTFLYNGTTINITSTSIVRAICWHSGYIESPIESKAYFINESYELPILVTITDSSNLTGPTGIYSNPWKEGIEWERFAQHQYFVNNELLFDVNSGIRIQGGNSLGMPKKSFRQHYRSKYGDDELVFPLFTHSNVNSFKHLVIKSGYDDDLTTSAGTLLRDPLSSELYRLVGNLSSASEWALLFLNTDFWGIYNLRESVDEEFIRGHYGSSDFDMVRFQKSGPELKYGDLNDWKYFDSIIRNTNFTIEDSYYKIADILDIDDFINLLAFNHCTQYRSWTWGASAYKLKKNGAKWKFAIWDTDRSFTDISWNGFYEYAYTSAEKWPNYIPLALIKNTLFKKALINRMADLLNTVFLPEYTTYLLDSIAQIIAPEIPREITRWGSAQLWADRVSNINSFLANRPQIVKTQIESYFSLDGRHTVELNVSGAGKILINSLNIRKFPWSGEYFEGIPIEITAIPDNGYKFTSWSNGVENNKLTDFGVLQDTSLTAYFVPDTNSQYDIIISEIMYNPSPMYPSDDWIEIHNTGDGANISGWWLTDGDTANRFTIPYGTVLNKNEYLVIAGDINKFLFVNPEVENVIGSFGKSNTSFGLSAGGECIKLYKNDFVLVDSVEYNDKSPWPEYADGNGPSLQLFDIYSNNDSPSNWKASLYPLYTPGSQNKIGSVPDNIFEFSEMEINVFPNPVADQFVLLVNSSVAATMEIQIFNSLGSLMEIQKLTINGETLFEFNSNNWEPGIYILQVKTEDKCITKKLIKK